MSSHMEVGVPRVGAKGRQKSLVGAQMVRAAKAKEDEDKRRMEKRQEVSRSWGVERWFESHRGKLWISLVKTHEVQRRGDGNGKRI